MNPALSLSVLGGLTAETRTLVDAMTVRPTSTRIKRIDRVIRGLKQSGVWDKLDVFYMLAAHDEQAGRLNWKNPGTFTLTANNSPTFTTDRGVSSDGATSYLDTGFNPTLVSAGYAQDSAHMGIWCQTNVSSASAVCGNANARIIPRSGTLAATNANNAASNSLTLQSATSVGHTCWSRSAAATYSSYKDGASLGDTAIASSAMTNATFWVCGRNGAAVYNTAVVSAFHVGSSLTASQVALLSALLQTYMQSVGAA